MRFFGVGSVMAVPWLLTLLMSDHQALNRELGRLCSEPPPEAGRVCRIHARLAVPY